MTHTPNEDEARIKLRGLIEAIGIVMLVSTDANGMLHARPMEVLKVEADTVCFFTDVNSTKALEIGCDHQVLLSCANPAAKDFVAVRGTARVMQDLARQKELWTESARPWYPDGATSPNLAVIIVDLTAGEYWDGPTSVARFACGYVSAQAAPRPVDPGENAKIRFGSA